MKPEAFYQLVEKFTGAGRKIDFFALKMIINKFMAIIQVIWNHY
jgi:hypothetical protein